MRKALVAVFGLVLGWVLILSEPASSANGTVCMSGLKSCKNGGGVFGQQGCWSSYNSCMRGAAHQAAERAGSRGSPKGMFREHQGGNGHNFGNGGGRRYGR